MSPTPADSDPLFGTRWVHVFEEDTDAGSVYRPDDDAVPLSRRPRERLELQPGGSAKLLSAGPDDRFVEQPATWKESGNGTLVIRPREGSASLEIVQRDPARLVVRMARGELNP